MSLADRIGTVIKLFCLCFNPCPSTLTKTDCCFITSMSRNNTRPQKRDTFTTHLSTTITHIIRSIFYNIAIFIGHSHMINVKIRLRKSIMATIFISHITSRRTTIREGSHFTILLHKCFIIQFLIRYYTHDRSTSISKTNYFIINFFALMKLTFKEF